MALPTGLRAFRHADFRRFFAAQFVAQVGSWMQTVAQSWLVLQLTSSPLLLGLIGTLQFGPILLFSIVSGAVADRVPKRRLLLVTQSVMGAQALVLGALVYGGHVEYWHVAVLATGVGLANVFDGPARQSFVAEMVGRADVGSAISLNSACFNSARIVGPSIGGVIIGRYGIAPAFVLNALGFAIAMAIMLTLRARGLPQPRSGQGVIQEILVGIRYVRRTREMLLALGLTFMVSLCVFNFTVYVPLVVRGVLG
ncbi:MAG: MFS transporter, partial [Myxococcota bacterium]